MRSPSPEATEQNMSIKDIFDDNGDIKEVTTLPLPLPAEEAFPRNRIPSPIPSEKDELDLNYVCMFIKIFFFF